MTPLFISFYTPDYEADVVRMMKSLDEHDLNYQVEVMEDLGGWHANCAHKPKFIWDMMDAHPGRDLVWIDADAVVRSRPAIFESKLGCDIGAVRFDHPRMKKRHEILSGTVFVRPTVGARRLVDRWIELCEEHPNRWDQRCLRDALGELVPDKVRWLQLPVSYAYINGMFEVMFPKTEPVIEHFQHSREMRKAGRL
jgi:hypothetical protein